MFSWLKSFLDLAVQIGDIHSPAESGQDMKFYNLTVDQSHQEELDT